MSVLSKRWRRMWYSVPTLNLCDVDICINKDRKVPFNKFVDKCLKCRETGMRFIADSSITRFKLEMTYYGRKTLVDKWLDFVIKNKVEELDLCLTPRYYQKRCFYCLPKAILNAQALTILKLENLKMEGPFQVNLPFLKLLFLKKVHGLNDRTFEDLLVNCPSLEDLGLKNCNELSTAQVLSSSLKSFEVELALDQTIKIEAVNLQCLQLQWFEDLNVGLTLESLTISKCHGWKHIHIKSSDLSKYYEKFLPLVLARLRASESQDISSVVEGIHAKGCLALAFTFSEVIVYGTTGERFLVLVTINVLFVLVCHRILKHEADSTCTFHLGEEILIVFVLYSL
ncbi:hypothetical protein TIFTF001_004039 [Ficus carica]|uniref:F-box/LRR-repeat protein 15/At3g58940/PEG3-like LRR domain-containing protein n=1 Tax=Ficus carica TaxID=3494 RepID=A0AA87ZJI0_FICCA|nr:hypothetical protein TIFTF001_004039 [Ficus carica]